LIEIGPNKQTDSNVCFKQLFRELAEDTGPMLLTAFAKEAGFRCQV